MGQVFSQRPIIENPAAIYSADGIAMPLYVKDPADIVDYTLDWSKLIPNDAIAAVVYTVVTAPTLTVISSNFTAETNLTTCWLQGGVLDTTYTITSKITTTAGRELEREFQVTIGQN